MKDRTIVGRLETILQVWEQILFLRSATLRSARVLLKGALRNWPRLRKAILDRTTPFNPSDFEIDSDVFKFHFHGLDCYRKLPETVADWSRCSRRVYQLSKDTQIDLELTSLSGVTWKDFYMPFPCFIVTLPIPLKGIGDNLIDTLVVRLTATELEVIALGNELDEFQRMPAKMRSGIATSSYNLNKGKTQDRVTEALLDGHFFVPCCDSASLDCKGPEEELYPERFDGSNINFLGDGHVSPEARSATARAWIPIFRIVVGLCLRVDSQYGEMVQSKSGLYTDNLPFTEDPEAITETENIMMVNPSHPLSDDERTLHELMREYGSLEVLKELASGFREAYHRRPPGKGHDPTCRKSVRVRWYIVGEKRLLENSLPQGACVVV